MILKTIKRLIFPSVTDNTVKEIQESSKVELDVASHKIKSHNDLLKKNGVTLKIFIATGGDHRHGS